MLYEICTLRLSFCFEVDFVNVSPSEAITAGAKMDTFDDIGGAITPSSVPALSPECVTPLDSTSTIEYHNVQKDILDSLWASAKRKSLLHGGSALQHWVSDELTYDRLQKGRSSLRVPELHDSSPAFLGAPKSPGGTDSKLPENYDRFETSISHSRTIEWDFPQDFDIPQFISKDDCELDLDHPIGHGHFGDSIFPHDMPIHRKS